MMKLLAISYSIRYRASCNLRFCGATWAQTSLAVDLQTHMEVRTQPRAGQKQAPPETTLLQIEQSLGFVSLNHAQLCSMPAELMCPSAGKVVMAYSIAFFSLASMLLPLALSHKAGIALMNLAICHAMLSHVAETAEC